MFFIGLGTATPPHCYTQHECWDAMHRSALFSQLAPRSRAILKKVFLSNNGIVTRHLALSPLEEGLDITPATLQARFAKHAPWRNPSGTFISREVDPILDKISTHGFDSLTEEERKTLEAARKMMK